MGVEGLRGNAMKGAIDEVRLYVDGEGVDRSGMCLLTVECIQESD